MATILLVEDHQEIWDFLSRRLKRRGYEVVVAQDGQAGLDTLAFLFVIACIGDGAIIHRSHTAGDAPAGDVSDGRPRPRDPHAGAPYQRISSP